MREKLYSPQPGKYTGPVGSEGGGGGPSKQTWGKFIAGRTYSEGIAGGILGVFYEKQREFKSDFRQKKRENPKGPGPLNKPLFLHPQ